MVTHNLAPISQSDPSADNAANWSPGEAERRIADHFHQTRYEDIPPATLDFTKCLMLDTIGAAIAGFQAEGATAVADLVTSWGGTPQARIIGRGDMVPAHQAAMANATMARALEIDDVHEQGMLHPTASIVPLALAVSEAAGGISGRQFSEAVVLGIDLAIRIGTAPRAEVAGGRTQPRTQSHTYHIGMLAGAMVAGKIMDLPSAGLQNAMGIAYSQCAGNLQAVAEGALTVRVQQGLSASAAIVSAELARLGVTGAMQSLTGVSGYYNALHGGRCDRAVLIGDLGRRYANEEVSIKPYPCCKHIHTAAAAAEHLVRERRIRADDIERVVIHVKNQEYYDLVCRPEGREERRASMFGERGMVHAQMSLPFVVAVALCDGKVSLDRFEAAGRTSDDVLSMMGRIETVMDGGPDDNVLPTPGIVDVYLAGASTPLTSEVRYVKGHPMNRMSFEDVAGKFMDMTDFSGAWFSRDRRRRIIEMIHAIETLPDMSDLAALLVADTSPANS